MQGFLQSEHVLHITGTGWITSESVLKDSGYSVGLLMGVKNGYEVW